METNKTANRLSKKAVLIAVFSFMLPCVAKAQSSGGLYVSLGAGTSILPPYTDSSALGVVDAPTLATSSSGKVFTNPTVSGIAAIGYGFNNGVRVELAGNVFYNGLNNVDQTTGGQVKTSGHQSVSGIMTDVFYDFHTDLAIVPYIGLGGGYQWLNYVNHSPAGFTSFKQSNGSPAYQVIGGISYRVRSLPGLTITAEYRFMDVTATSLSANVSHPIAYKRGRILYDTFLFGFRYRIQ